MIKKLFSTLLAHKKPFILGQIAMLVGTAAGLAFPWAVREVFDTLFETTRRQWLLPAIGLLAAVFAVREMANYFKTCALDTVGHKMVRDLRAQLYAKLLELSLGYYDQQSSGQIASRMTNDIHLVQGGLSSGLTTLLQQALSLIAVLVLLVHLDPVLTGVVLAIVPLVIAISKVMGGRVRAITQRVQERLGTLTVILNESIAGIDIIKAFVLEHRAKGLFRGQNDQILTQSLRSMRVTAGARLAIGLLNSAFTLVVIGLGGYRVARGHLTPPDLIAFILYSEMVAGPVATLANVWVEIHKALAAFQRIWEVLSTPNGLHRRTAASLPALVPPAPLAGRIEFRDVSFSYDGRQPVLRGISHTIEPGQTVALVGPSGVGKSTLVKLIPRFYDPGGGSIAIDGMDTKEMDVGFLRGQIAIVPQDTYLFGMSIHDNIACGQPDASPDEVMRAAQLAHAHDFILQQPHGYQTQIGERGARLSGGQRQRIAIARAFLKDPRILILDEATSALDTHSESVVQAALSTLMQERTTLIIAHRLSTVERADQILVFKEGQILAAGTHGELLEACPFYGDLYQKQFAPQRDEAFLRTLCANR